MPNMSLEKTAMPEADAKIRSTNFEEVSLGYTPEMAMQEAARCIGCKKKPCVSGCPVQVQIPEFIKKVEEGKFIEAYEIIKETNGLPAVCGRVCPQETQCEEKCVRGIKGDPVGIGRLERFCADYAIEQKHVIKHDIKKNGIKVAAIGSGPAGLTFAADMAMKGYDVTVFEAFHTPGGVLVYGIPEFRLPKSLVQTEIDALGEMGVELQTNMVIGRVLTLDELKEMGYKGIFIGSGAGLPRFMRIPGEGYSGVYSANEYLTRINLMKAYQFPNYATPMKKYKSVAVIGGGNVAMDAARCAKRMGAENVYIVYRRSEKEMPARVEEIHHAKEEGIEFHMLTNPTRILGDEKGWVTGMENVKMELGEPDESGRRRPVTVEGSEYIMDVEAVIVAVGTSPNPLIKDTTPGLDTESWGGIIADQEGLTSLEHVYAGDDAVTGAATVILAMGAGKDAAKAMDRELSK